MVLSYILKRILWVIPTLLVVALVSFGIVSLMPGDFFTPYKLAAAQSGFDPEEFHGAMLALRGLDKPWIVQFYYWVEGIVLHGDFGYSFMMKRPAAGIVLGPTLGWTAVLIIPALLLAWLFAVPLGILAAAKYRSPLDLALSAVTLVFASTPPHLLALIFIFGIYKWLDPLIIVPYLWGVCDWSLRGAPLTWSKVGSHIIHLTPAWLIIGIPVFAFITRFLRMELLGSFGAPYLVTARGKGLRESVVLTRHAFRNALLPLISMSGYVLTATMTGSILACQFLGMPGTGLVMVVSAHRQDQALFTATLLVYGVLLTVGTLISDLLLLSVDPRIRYD